MKNEKEVNRLLPLVKEKVRKKSILQDIRKKKQKLTKNQQPMTKISARYTKEDKTVNTFLTLFYKSILGSQKVLDKIQLSGKEDSYSL